MPSSLHAGTKAPRTAWPAPGLRIVLALLAAFLAIQYGYGLTVAFINDDYIFLDKTRGMGFPSLWAPRDLLFHYYRPWSRELHYWVLQGAFGARELPFHVTSFVLWLAVMGSYFALVRHLAGAGTAALATACVAALAAWAVPILWAAGAQELWMLLCSLLTLLAIARDRIRVACVGLALALLSKETAVVLAPIALAQRWVLGGGGWREALARTAPLWVLTGAWAALHPLFGGRLWWPIHEPPAPGVHPSPGLIAGHTLLALVNLAPWPRPESGWESVLVFGLPAAILLAALVTWALAGRSRPELTGRRGDAPAPPRTLMRFGLVWAVLGWLPLAMPSIAWRSHYVLFGALGFWLAVAAWLGRRTRLSLAVVVALALLRPAVADTPSRDWSSEWYRRRAAAFIEHLRADLLLKQPSPPPHSRMFFIMVPSGVGFLAGNGPALRVWYGDSTLQGGFYADYRPRAAGAARGPDFFFRFDSTTGWVPVRRGPENVAMARRANPRWVRDHDVLAQTLARAGDWGSAAVEYAKLADSESLRVDYGFNAGLCYETLGDSAAAASWYTRAAALPDADDDVRSSARRLSPYLQRSR